MQTQPIVFVVDDDAAVRKSLDMLLRAVGLEVKTFASAQEFLAALDPAQPGCLILDVRMPGMSGLEVQRVLVERGAHLPVIIVTGHGDVAIAVRALKAGAAEFLEKPFSKELLVEHIREALARDAQRRAERTRRTDIEARLATLTQRERQVMEQVVAGRVSKEIAAALGLSKKTIDVHRGRAMHKMQTESVAELVEMVLATRPAGPQPAAQPALVSA